MSESTMSDHVWTQENVAAYLAGGLEPAEEARLEKHVRECAACRGVVAEARLLERKFAPLLSRIDPGPALEDRMIRALPPAPPSTNLRCRPVDFHTDTPRTGDESP